MSLIRVTSEDLQSLSGQVSAGSTSIQDQLSSMAGQVSSVVGGDWQGVASSQFGVLWEQWQTSAAGLNEALTGIANLLAQAGSQYQTTEDAIRSSMG